MNRFIIKALLIGAFTSPTQATVIESSSSHFKIELKATTPAKIAESYAQFIRINEWWNAEHSWFGNAEAFSLEPIAGGCFCEVDGDQQVMHMTVSFVDPNKEVRMLGGLGPLQMMAVTGAMSWSFIDLGAEGTEIRHSYTVLGDASQKLDQLAPIVDSVQSGQLLGLINRLASQAAKQ